MAKITYAAPEVRTANEARLLSLHLYRETSEGVDYLVVEGTAQIGYYDGALFTPERHISFRERSTLAAAVTYFGGSVLSTVEAKVLERMQATGLLPAGTIS